MKKQNSVQTYAAAHRFLRHWRGAVTCLAAVVVFCTVYALILPAITMEKDPCSLAEHTHTENCYTQVTTVTRTVPECTLAPHIHTDACLDQDGNPVCGYGDFVVHQHDKNCYLPDGSFWCTLPEIEAHTHDDSCYAPAHSHTEACETPVQGELLCQEKSEEHTHSEECYAWENTLTCTQSTEPVRICGKEEVIVHTHKPYVSEEAPGCFSADGSLTCGQTEVLSHQHSGGCLKTVEEPADTTSLTCQIPEGEGGHSHDETCYGEDGSLICTLEETPGHQHTDRCYGTWELTCGMEEHTHTDACRADATEAAATALDETGDGVYVYEDDTLRVTVVLPEDTAVPRDAQLVVTPVTAASGDYEALTRQATDAASGTPEQIVLYDISFFSDGEYLPVSEQATVSFRFKQTLLAESGEVVVLHFDQGEEAPVALDTVEVQRDEDHALTDLTFDTNGFSVYAVMTLADEPAAQSESNTFTLTYGSNTITFYIVDTEGNPILGDYSNITGENAKLYLFSSIAPSITGYTYSHGVAKIDNQDKSVVSVSTSNYTHAYGTNTGTFQFYIHDPIQDKQWYTKGGNQTVTLTYSTNHPLDGKTFAIVNRAKGDYAMTAETFPSGEWRLGVPGLKAQQVVMSTGSDGVNYASGTGIVEWTFHAAATAGEYTISTEVNGTTKYLRFLESKYSNAIDETRGSLTLADEGNATRVTVTDAGNGGVYIKGVNGGCMNRAGEGNGFWAAATDNSYENSKMYLCEIVTGNKLFYNLNISGHWSNTPSIPETFQEITTEAPSNLYVVENKSAAGTFAKKTTTRGNVIRYYENYNQTLANAGNLTAETYRAPGAEFRFEGWQATVNSETWLFAENAVATLQTDGIHIVDTTGVERVLPIGTTLTGRWTQISDLVMFFVNTGDTMLETQNDKVVTSTANPYYIQVLAVGHIYNSSGSSIPGNTIQKENHAVILSKIVPEYDPNSPQTQVVIDAIAKYNNGYTLEAAQIANESALEEAVGAYLRADTSRAINFENIPIDGKTITTQNYKLYWYKMTNQTGGDAWHIDGVLVAKTQPMQIYKMFSGLESTQVDTVYGNLNFSVGLNVEDNQGHKSWSDYIDMNNVSQTGIYTAHGKQAGSNSYLWTLNAVTAQGYTFTEENYAVDGYDHTCVISVQYHDGEPKSVQNTVTTYDSESKFPERGIKGGDATSVIFANFYTPTGTGAFNIIKESNDGIRLANAEFTLTQEGDNSVVATQTTNQNGAAYFSNLPAVTRSYTLSETTAPDGYEAIDKKWIVEVVASGSEDDSYVSSVTIFDTDSSGNKTGEGTVLFTRDANGAITMNLECKVTNTPRSQTLTIIKNFEGISDEDFQTLRSNTENPYQIGLTDGSGQTVRTLTLDTATPITGKKAFRWKVTGLTAGDYTLKETNYNHENYADTVVTAQVNGTTVAVTKGANTASCAVKKNSTADTVTLTNTYTNTFTLKLKKVDSANNNKPLVGAVFNLYGPFADASITVPEGVSRTIRYADDRTAYYIGQTISGADGVASYSGLKFQTTYVVDEFTAPEGYVKPDKPQIIQPVTVSSGGYSNGVLTRKVPNTSKADAKTKVTAEKRWNVPWEVNACPSITLTLYQVEGESTTATEIGSITLNAAGNVSSTGITPTVNGWKVTWSDLPAYKADTDTPYTYYIAETPIAGFATSYSTTVTSLTVGSKTVQAALAEGTEQTRFVTVTNTSSYELPKTGGCGTSLFTCGGTALALSACLLLFVTKSKRRKKKSTTP